MKYIWLWLLLAISIAGQAQNLTTIEYFFDDDPGIGNGTTINVTPNDSLIVSTTIPTTSLGFGFHKLFCRTMLEDGTWSLYEGRTIYIQPIPADLSSDLIEAEYFYDTDPGLGNGINLSATTGDSLLVDTSVPTTGLDPGFHKLFVRSKNEIGIWTLYEGRTIYIQSPVDPIEPLMTYAEYFYDVDPGIGNGTAFAVTPDDSLMFDAAVPTAGLSEGFHKLFVRAKNDDNMWSLYEGRTLYIQQLPNPDTLQLVAAEYYYDVEPGIGMGTMLDVIPGDSIDANFTVPQSLPAGVHTMFLRVQASNGEWSLFEARIFDSTVGVDDLHAGDLASLQNYPNPFVNNTQLEIYLSRAEDVTIEILDVSGKIVRLIPMKVLNSGTHKIMLDASDLAEGSYCCRLITPSFSKTRQMVLVR
ncbi:MAG: T9SS type A sorting domain-containing protein [Flavobacteriales bacterium]